MSWKKPPPGWEEFLTLCSAVEKRPDLSRLFSLFFTLEEQETFGKRLLIVRALREGKMSQREIAKTLGVSIAQITRGSNALKIIDPALASLLDTLLG